MPKSIRRKSVNRSSVLDKIARPIAKEFNLRFEKAEIAALGILLFILLFFPIAIFLSGLVAFGAFKYWKHHR